MVVFAETLLFIKRCFIQSICLLLHIGAAMIGVPPEAVLCGGFKSLSYRNLAINHGFVEANCQAPELLLWVVKTLDGTISRVWDGVQKQAKIVYKTIFKGRYG